MASHDLDLIGLPSGREFRLAEKFGDHLIRLVKPWSSGARVRVVSVPSLQCHGFRVQDIDQLVFLLLDPPVEVSHGRGRVRLGEVLLVVEVKGHRGPDVQFADQSVLVRYHDPQPHWLNVSEKAMDQVASVRGYLREIAAFKARPVHAVFLPEVDQADIPAAVPSALGGNFRIGNLLELLVRSRVGNRVGEMVEFRAQDPVEVVIEEIRRARAPTELSPLGKGRVQRITERYARDQQFYQAVGRKLLVYQGKAGTGKTSFMVRLANDLARQGQRSLFLTYNHTLRVELLTLLNSDEAMERLRRARAHTGTGVIPRVEVAGLDKFLFDVLCAAELHTGGTIPDYEREYPNLVARIAQLPPARLDAVRRREPFRFDFVFVDEAQDIRPEERDALLALFGLDRLIISLGHDQIIRGQVCDWLSGLEESRFHIRRNNRSLRMKEGIVRFVDRLADLAAVPDYEGYEGAELPGGRVLVHVGKYTRELHALVMADLVAADSDARPGDLLMAIHREHGAVDLADRLRATLRELGVPFWDGLDRETRRRNIPLRPDEVRICDYMSVRGLEAWTMVCHWLDRFHADAEHRLPRVEGDLFARQRRAFGLVAIACSRPVNTLVITLSDASGDFSRACIQAAREDPEHCSVTGA